MFATLIVYIMTFLKFSLQENLTNFANNLISYIYFHILHSSFCYIMLLRKVSNVCRTPYQKIRITYKSSYVQTIRLLICIISIMLSSEKDLGVLYLGPLYYLSSLGHLAWENRDILCVYVWGVITIIFAPSLLSWVIRLEELSC